VKKKNNLSKYRFYIYLAIVLLGNVLVLAGLIFVLSQIPKKALEIQKIRSLQIKGYDDLKIVESEIERAIPKIKKIEALFPDESGLLPFINKIDDLKKRGIVTDFSFASGEVVKDKLGYLGIPFALELTGRFEEVRNVLEEIWKLPYLIRTIETSVKIQPEGGLVIYKYGGFLYVSQNFFQN